MYMKAIQITMDEGLLAELDQDAEVRRDGRSAVFRRAVRDYLRRKRAAEVRAQYQRAYGAAAGLGSEFGGWEEEGAWPEP